MASRKEGRRTDADIPGPVHEPLGVKYARYICRTMAFFQTVSHREKWLERYAPWMDGTTRAELAGLSAHWYSPKYLAQRLELYDEDRERLKAWSIAAVDVDDEQRKVINMRKHRERQERYRRKSGAQPREQYLASVKSPQPWVALGMTRAKYYRLGLHRSSETGSVPALSTTVGKARTLSHCRTDSPTSVP
jgi:hypothetical protein